MAARRLGVICAALVAGVPACVSVGFPRATPPDLYALDPPATAKFAGPGANPKPIVVAAPRAVPGLETRAMVYVRREHEIRYFSRSAWVDPPARMLAPLLARALEGRGAFQVVRDAAAERAAHLRLETDLVRLQQEFMGHPSRIRLVLRVRLLEAFERRVLGDQEIEVVETAPSDDAYGGVVAANAAAARAVAEVAAACATWAGGASSAGADARPRLDER